MCSVSTISLLRAVRAGDDCIAASDHLMSLGYSRERAVEACRVYKPGRYRSSFASGRLGWHVAAMSDYALAVERGLEELHAVSTGACPGCADCAEAHGFDADDGSLDEGSFSWCSCGICGSTFGGDRYYWHAIRVGDESREILHFDDACEDCRIYLANGDEPDEWYRSPAARERALVEKTLDGGDPDED